MKDAVRQVEDGVILELDISAGSKETAIKGYNPWRKRIEIRLSERAQKGKANAELMSFLSNLFNVHSRNVEIISGSTNSKKSVKIIQAQAEDILKILTNENK
ncbi:MAG: DUF167 domain-containing protein [Candidatus Methanoperedens sp.]|nr:DUF167 domain-containing protein [Candidatus Methanoperedens sp.]